MSIQDLRGLRQWPSVYSKLNDWLYELVTKARTKINMRKILSQEKLNPVAAQSIAQFHNEVVAQVEAAIGSHEWVIVGMRMNPVVKKAKKLLAQNSIKFEYVEFGSYTKGWKERLAIKLWSGWPTFPQVFHKGILIGGASDLAKCIQNKN